MRNKSRNAWLAWLTRPRATLEDTGQVSLGETGRAYTLTLEPAKKTRVFRGLAEVRTPDQAVQFVRRYGALTESEERRGAVSPREVLREATLLRESVSVAEGLRDRGLRAGERRKRTQDLWEALRRAPDPQARRLWADWEQQSGGSASRLRGTALLAALISIRTSHLHLDLEVHARERAQPSSPVLPLAEWSWRVRVPDLLTYLWMEFATDFLTGRPLAPALCPWCGREFVRRRSDQKFCSVACRVAAWRSLKPGRRGR